MVKDIQGSEGVEVEPGQGLATSNGGVPGKSGEGRHQCSNGLENIIRSLHFELTSSSYLVSETHGANCGKTSGKQRWVAWSLEEHWRLLLLTVVARAH